MDPNNSYDAYVEGTDFVPKQNDYRNWHVPKRGVDARVDKLINTLVSPLTMTLGVATNLP